MFLKTIIFLNQLELSLPYFVHHLDAFNMLRDSPEEEIKITKSYTKHNESLVRPSSNYHDHSHLLNK